MMTPLTDELELLYGPPLDIISNALRGFITAAPGDILRVADFSQIEARGLAWLAGAEKILEVFRDPNEHIYCLAAEDIFGRKITKKGDPFEYSVGKVVVLACGYQGGVGAFQSMAKNYLVKVPDDEAAKIVKAWRTKNPEIVTYWSDVEHAAIAALKDRKTGTAHKAGAPGREVTFGVRGSFLFAKLPSFVAGYEDEPRNYSRISYPYPSLVDYVWIRKAKLAVSADGADILEISSTSRRVPCSDLSEWIARGWKQNGEPGPAIHYKYVDPITKQWVEGPTYGGSLVENITQRICRDILASALLRLSQRGYETVMHVHDEAVTETPEDFGSTEELEAIMAEDPGWAAGFPIAAEGYSRKRYKK